MPLVSTVDHINVTQDGQLNIRLLNIVTNDEGTEVSRDFHGYVLEPGQDIDAEPEVVKELAAKVWTEECVSAFLAAKAIRDAKYQ